MFYNFFLSIEIACNKSDNEYKHKRYLHTIPVECQPLHAMACELCIQIIFSCKISLFSCHRTCVVNLRFSVANMQSFSSHVYNSARMRRQSFKMSGTTMGVYKSPLSMVFFFRMLFSIVYVLCPIF